MELIATLRARAEQVTALQGNDCASEFKIQYDLLKRSMIEYKQKANYWEAQYNQIKSEENKLKKEIEELKAALHKREQQLFGKKSEKKSNFSESSAAKAQKNRGQQPGSKGHGRRDHGHLPVIEETLSLCEESCPCCGLFYETLEDTEDSSVLEIINVQAYQRAIKRKKYKRTCSCEKNLFPQIIAAPVVEKLLPKSSLGISIWASLLVNKYGYQNPLYRTLKQWRDHGLNLAMGTVTDGFQKILPLLMPVYDAVVQRSLMAEHWHADETRWKVFETIEGKKNNNWFLWIFNNNETVVFRLDPSRSSKVLSSHFGQQHNGGTLNVDRYVAYKVIAKAGLFVLAFCWAHVRRDFLNYNKGYPHHEAWGLAWTDRINNLYHINNERIKYEKDTSEFHEQDILLKQALIHMQEQFEKEIKEPALPPSAKKLLVSLKKHWGGLTIFSKNPEVPMDNNSAERGLRPSVCGRKNYYGSGAVWSGELATVLFSLFETLKLWNINIHTWVLAYFHECATSGSKAPTDVKRFLPWEMTEQQKILLSHPPRYENSE